MAWSLSRRKSPRRTLAEKHPYLHGNFAPTYTTCPLTPCTYTGSIPNELAGGQYVRNGGNPVSNQDLGRDAHWFDGDGMLSGVLFERVGEKSAELQPSFVNQFIVTDILQSALNTPALRRPVLPSIATLVNPLSTLLQICIAVFRSVVLVFLTHLPGSKQVIKKISVANTSIMYHDGRALATCESGPPMRVALPSLETIGWYNGKIAQGESQKGGNVSGKDVFGGDGLLGWMKEWTTAHPKVDPVTNEMILFHSTFAPPYMHYSILPAEQDIPDNIPPVQRLLNAPVAGISGAKMMHDFGVSHRHTVVLDLPLTLDPLQLAKGRAPISYDKRDKSRFGVFPRREPSNTRFFETDACCIFHTANTWDVVNSADEVTAVDLLACRQVSAAVVFNAGNIAGEVPGSDVDTLNATTSFEKARMLEESTTPLDEEEQCRLYYYSFDLTSSSKENRILHQFGLSKVPFEFPSVSPEKEMTEARYVYGCTSATSNFNSALGRVAQIDALVKFDTKELISRGKAQPPANITGCVDNRSVDEIIAAKNEHDAIKIFSCPDKIYAQEPRFVPREKPSSEDDGFLIFYTFDESQLDDVGEPLPEAKSELWVIDAKTMSEVILKVHLPQRVPYGLHGSWFPERQIAQQRPFESTRRLHTGVTASTLIQRLHLSLYEIAVRAFGG